MPNTEVDASMAADVVKIWRRLEEKCSICCKGSMCNEGLLPESSTLDEPSSAHTPQVSAAIVAILLMFTFWV